MMPRDLNHQSEVSARACQTDSVKMQAVLIRSDPVHVKKAPNMKISEPVLKSAKIRPKPKGV